MLPKCGGMMGQDPLPFLRPRQASTFLHILICSNTDSRPSQLQLAHPAVADYFVW